MGSVRWRLVDPDGRVSGRSGTWGEQKKACSGPGEVSPGLGLVVSSGWRYVVASRTVVVAQAVVVVSVLDLRSFVRMWMELLVEYIFRWEVC